VSSFWTIPRLVPEESASRGISESCTTCVTVWKVELAGPVGGFVFRRRPQRQFPRCVAHGPRSKRPKFIWASPANIVYGSTSLEATPRVAHALAGEDDR
jgi:hypothetical protein